MSEDKPVVHSHAEWSLPNDEGDRQLAVWFDDDTGFEPGDAVTALLTSEYKALAAENAQLRQRLEEARKQAAHDFDMAHTAMADAQESRARLQTLEGERDKHLAEAVDVHVRLQAAQRENGALKEALVFVRNDLLDISEGKSFSVTAMANRCLLRIAAVAPASPAATVQGEECDCAKTLPPGHHRCSRPSGEVVWRKGVQPPPIDEYTAGILAKVPPTPPTSERGHGLNCESLAGGDCNCNPHTGGR